MKTKAIIFDIDGTLTPQNSWTAFTADMGASIDDHLAIYRSHLDGKIDLDASKEQLLTMWQATGRATKQHILEMYARWPIHPEAKPLIAWLKQQGYLICLNTGSVGVYAQHIAKELGIDEYYANAELFFDEDGSLASFHYTANQAEIKAEHFMTFCKKHRLQPSQCVAVGDGDNDIELFRLTGNGILIKGSKHKPELGKAAWKTIDSLDQIPTLLSSTN
jgi:phosphoserine phosphatase